MEHLLSWSSVISALVSAGFWLSSAFRKEFATHLSSDTKEKYQAIPPYKLIINYGMDILYRDRKGRYVDVPQSMLRQSRDNSVAAIFTAITVILQLALLVVKSS